MQRERVVAFYKSHKKHFIIVLACLAVVAVAVLFMIVSTSRQRSQSAKSEQCSENVTNVSNSLNAPKSREDFDKGVSQLSASDDSCKNGKSTNREEDATIKFNYNYLKATSDYKNGKFDESKKEAQIALDVYQNFDNSKKQSEEIKSKVEHLNQIKEGVY